MFRRHWSGLPMEVSFPSDLKSLGYFVNEEDEIRSIGNPDCYFKFFINRNERINARQRFGFNRAMEKIIHERLEKQNLEKIALPLGTPPSQRHVPIFASKDLASCTRIVVIFGESTQDLGVLAGRVANGPGGIDKGSMVSVVRALQQQVSSLEDEKPPGIVLANMGQLYWWPEEKRCLTVKESQAIPLPSLVHMGMEHVPSVNEVPGNESMMKHVEYVFEYVLGTLAGLRPWGDERQAKLDVIAIGESCHVLQTFFDTDMQGKAWVPRLNAMLLLGTVYGTENLTNIDLEKFLAQRTRGYLISSEPVDTPLASAAGNPDEGSPALGCPCFSSGEPSYTEMILITALEPALAYLQTVATTQGTFVNPYLEIIDRPTEAKATVVDDDWHVVDRQFQDLTVSGVEPEEADGVMNGKGE